MQRAVDESNHTLPWTVEMILNRWVTQGGFPVLTVTRSASTANSVTVAQGRYLTDRSLTSTERWHVPVNWVLSTAPNFTNTQPMAWIPPSFPAQAIDIPELSEADWFIFNKQQTGYYRVNYDEANWAALAKALDEDHELIHVLNRANLLDDAFNLARNGRLNYNHAFTLSLYLMKEKDYIPWGAVNPSFTYLDVALSASEAYPSYQSYLRALSAPLYEELGFTAVDGEEHVTPLHRNIILNLNCRHGNTHCVDTAATLLEQFRNNPSQRLNPDIQNVVYCSALRGGSAENFNFLWDTYLQSTDSSEQSILLNAMGCTTNTERRNFYLNQTIAEESEVREQDRHTIIVSVISSSPAGMDDAFDFVYENFHLIQPRVQTLTGSPNILNAFGRTLTSQDHAARVERFVERHSSLFTAGEWAAVNGIRENIAASITWSAENAAVVEEWLEEHYGSGGTVAITSSLLLLISAIITIVNN